jgi:large subunit ribosomal protein L15
MLIYAPDHFGRHGFRRPSQIVDRPHSVNVGELEGLEPILKAAKALQREGETLVANLEAIGVNRLLGGGSTTPKWKVRVAHATRHAREKVTIVEESTASPS